MDKPRKEEEKRCKAADLYVKKLEKEAAEDEDVYGKWCVGARRTTNIEELTANSVRLNTEIESLEKRGWQRI